MSLDTWYRQEYDSHTEQSAADCPGGRKSEHVTSRELRKIVRRTAQALGIGSIPELEINKVYGSTMTESRTMGDIQIWVDKFYVAWQNGTQDVRYAYITRFHIEEEIEGYREASEERGRDISLPEDIQAAFARAEMIMRQTGSQFWIDANCK